VLHPEIGCPDSPHDSPQWSGGTDVADRDPNSDADGNHGCNSDAGGYRGSDRYADRYADPQGLGTAERYPGTDVDAKADGDAKRRTVDLRRGIAHTGAHCDAEADGDPEPRAYRGAHLRTHRDAEPDTHTRS
jgi:hypothetical protein